MKEPKLWLNFVHFLELARRWCCAKSYCFGIVSTSKPTILRLVLLFSHSLFAQIRTSCRIGQPFALAMRPYVA